MPFVYHLALWRCYPLLSLKVITWISAVVYDHKKSIEHVYYVSVYWMRESTFMACLDLV